MRQNTRQTDIGRPIRVRTNQWAEIGRTVRRLTLGAVASHFAECAVEDQRRGRSNSDERRERQ